MSLDSCVLPVGVINSETLATWPSTKQMVALGRPVPLAGAVEPPSSVMVTWTEADGSGEPS